MVTLTASQARQELFPLLAAVNDDRDVVRITSKSGNGVLMSEVEYDAWLTTLHLQSTQANAAWIAKGLAEARSGQARMVDPAVLDEDDL